MSDTSQNTFGAPPAATGYLPPYVPPFRPPGDLATALTVLFSLTIGVDLLLAAAYVYVRQLLGSGSVAYDDLTRADGLQALSDALQTLLLVPTAVVFIIWFFRIRKNADFFAPDACEMKSGWAIGAWFIPIGNLWLPRKIAGEVWNASTDWDSEPRGTSQTSMNVWWVLFVASSLLQRFSGAEYSDGASATELKHAAGTMIFFCVLDAMAAVFAILFVRKLTRMQLDKATARWKQILPQPQP
ncbi:hypothetical protein GCM10022207_33550 [Streptomyces lannensis]|uniref:DUF4328 domain-containing protein n=1 Tax=Streptomyces lannensis TaxID=766498 RepID=A0ABP7K5U6_9ACTN